MQPLFGMHRAAAFSAIVAACALLAATPAQAAASATQANLQAASRALGFLDSLRGHDAIAIGVIYAPSAPNNKADAARVAEQLSALAGPNASTIRASAVAVEDLAHATQRFDALYLMQSATPSATAISGYVRQHQVVSISGDPACLDAKCCVLMVQSGAGVNIVLDTALAAAVGAQFSSVFTMMVKRK